MEALASGAGVQQLERLVRVAIFQSANELVGFMLQEAADRIDATYQPKPGQHRKGRVRLDAQGMFGRFVLWRDYYYDPAKHQGHYPADAGLGLEIGYTPALARLICLVSTLVACLTPPASWGALSSSDSRANGSARNTCGQ